jgi:Penicillin amidase
MVPGWTGEYEWEGYIPFEKMPHALNPECGYVISANNPIMEEGDLWLGNAFTNGHRAHRLRELIECAFLMCLLALECVLVCECTYAHSHTYTCTHMHTCARRLTFLSRAHMYVFTLLPFEPVPLVVLASCFVFSLSCDVKRWTRSLCRTVNASRGIW